MNQAAANDLRDKLRGPILLPGDIAYDDARQIHNGMFQHKPAIIAQSLGTADVIHAIDFAREHDLEIAVRGGGHSVAGKSVCDGGIMIDLSLMKAVHVDPKNRTARAQGGALWGDFNRETQIHGLATTGGVVSTTGIAGLTLGGGLGWLLGKHGLAADNLIAAQLVTAGGDVLRASPEDDAELLWGLRGGGGNFGVVPWFEFQLHPVGPIVTSGIYALPIDNARELLQHYREFTASLPDELTLYCGLLHAPDGSGLPIATTMGCHCGPLDVAEADIKPIKNFGSPILDTFGPTTYEDTNALMFDDGFPKGARNYWKSSFLTEFNDEVIDTIIQQFAACPSIMSGILIEHLHGDATRVPLNDTAFPRRREGYNVLIAAEWMDPKDDKENIAWARATYDALRPHLIPESYANYQTEEDTKEKYQRPYGANYDRLLKLKNKLDPQNIFHMNANIKPTTKPTHAISK